MDLTDDSLSSRLLRPLLWLHRRLLPNAPWAGWTPYLWLVYLGFFFIQWPGMPPWDATKWFFSCWAALIFLVLYFRAFNCNARELASLLAGMATLGYDVLLSGHRHGPHLHHLCLRHDRALRQPAQESESPGAHPRRKASWSRQAPCIWRRTPPTAHSIWFWLPTVVFGIVIGAANAWFADDEAKRRVILQSQEEIRRLAATAES